MTAGPEAEIARHIVGCRYEQFPEPALAVAKRSVVDGIAVLMAGRAAAGMDALLTFGARWGGPPEARIFATGIRGPAPAAAWVNAAHMRALELDDTTDSLPLHPTAAALPALLALADLAPLSGRDFLRALLLAQDLIVRFGLAVKKNAMQSGRNDLYRIFAATAAVAAAMRLDEETTLNALGLSASYASGDLQCVLEGTMAGWVQYGNTASGALQSCLLAQLGVTGPRAFLSGRGGYLTVFEPEHDVAILTDGLGERFEGTRISVKPYAACRATHAMVDLARAFRDSGGAPDQIERIEIVVSPEVYNLVGGPRELRLKPETSAAAQFSAHFITATALLKGGMGLTDSALAQLTDQPVLELAQKVHVSGDAAYRTSEIIGRTQMTIHTSAGAPFVQDSDRPLGGPGNPVSMEMLAAKLRDCLAFGGREVAARDIDRFVEAVGAIESAPDVGALFDPFA